jgi:hypothetical protein
VIFAEKTTRCSAKDAYVQTELEGARFDYSVAFLFEGVVYHASIINFLSNEYTTELALLCTHILKLREQIKKAAPGVERKKLSVPLRKLFDELFVTIDACKQKGTIDEKDVHGIIKALDFLYQELYSQYKELAQEDSMLRDYFARWQLSLVD